MSTNQDTVAWSNGYDISFTCHVNIWNYVILARDGSEFDPQCDYFAIPFCCSILIATNFLGYSGLRFCRDRELAWLFGFPLRSAELN